VRIAVKLLILCVGLLLVYAGAGLPALGDPNSPAAQHVAKDYAEHAYHDSHTPNIVTVMIADYRSFDTLGETVVVFAAGMACFFLLRGESGRQRQDDGRPGGEEGGS